MRWAGQLWELDEVIPLQIKPVVSPSPDVLHTDWGKRRKETGALNLKGVMFYWWSEETLYKEPRTPASTPAQQAPISSPSSGLRDYSSS
jgi:hypothetical protein